MTRPAALIDFENIVFDARSPFDLATCQHRIAQVRQVTDSMRGTVAIQTVLAERYLHLLDAGPWRVLFVDSHPDAADEALMRSAFEYVDDGTTDLVIASGDRRFADLASYARLHVLSMRGATSAALKLAATTHIHLDPHPAPGPKPRTSSGTHRKVG